MRPNFRQSNQSDASREFEEKIVQVNRTSKKTKGGNQISFSVLVVVGDRKGRVGVGLGKAPDVARSVQKATNYAKRHFINVPITHGTIPHDIFIKWGAARILLKSAPEGTGIIAGGPVRAVVETAGITNIVSKILGTSNKVTNVYATLAALKQLGKPNIRMNGKANGTIDEGESKSKKSKSKNTK